MCFKSLIKYISQTLTLLLSLNMINFGNCGNSFKFPSIEQKESGKLARSERTRPFVFSQRKLENGYNTFESPSNHIYDEIDKDNYDYKGWNYLDDNQPYTAHELQKTANLQIVDDPFYIPGRPPWPHNEYYAFPNIGLYNPVVGSGYFPFRNGSGDTKASEYVWQQLPYEYTGPGYPHKDANGEEFYQHYYTGVQKNGDKAESNRDGTKFAESAQSDKKHGGGYSPYDFDFFKRKRFRLELNPGIIAAPIAGLAAYKLVSWYASKPLLFELGLVDHKHGHGPHGLPGGYPIPPPGLGPIGPIHGVPVYPASSPSLTYPIVASPFRDEKKPEQTTTKKPWWNPFASLTPRRDERK